MDREDYVFLILDILLSGENYSCEDLKSIVENEIMQMPTFKDLTKKEIEEAINRYKSFNLFKYNCGKFKK